MTSLPRSYEHVLGNGLRVVTLPSSHLHRTAVTLFVGVGSRYESAIDNGISHFLEHMLYRGTKKHPSAHSQNLAFERLGCTLYAATHADHTTLSLNLPPKSLAPAMELLGELLHEPRFGEIDVERRIVREEILEDLDEDGRQIDADNVVRTVTFGDHPLGYTITGPLEALDRFDDRTLRDHLARHYVARNMVLAVGGLADPDDINALADHSLGRLPSGQKIEPSEFRSPQTKPRRRHVSSPGSQTDLRVSFLTPGEQHRDAAAIELLMRVIDDGMSTRLYHRLCDAGGLVYDCSASWEPFHDCGVIDFAAEVQHERVPEVAEACLAIARELSTSGPLREEVDKARDRHRWDVEATVDDAGELSAFAGGAVFFERDRLLEQHLGRYDGIDERALTGVARSVFSPKNLAVVTIGTLATSQRDRLRAAIAAYGERAP